PVIVDLVGVVVGQAVVAHIAQAIAVDVLLVGVGCGRAVIAGVARTVAVAIRLVRIDGIGTVVQFVRDTVTIHVRQQQEGPKAGSRPATADNPAFVIHAGGSFEPNPVSG